MKTIKYFLIAIIGIIAISCSNDNTTDPTGTLSLKLTDAPMHYGQFMTASVTIDKIEIGNSTNANSFVTIMNTQMKFNMLELVNGITKSLASTPIPVGDYDMVRLYISDTQMTLKNGTSFNYNMGQNGFSGNGMGMMQNGIALNNDLRSIDIKLDKILNISTGTMKECLMDLDVANSFHLEGVAFSGSGSNMMMNMSGYTFSPTMRIVDMGNAGTITGTIHDATVNLPNATVSLMHNGTLYTSTHTDANGNYTFIGIPQGTYTMSVELDGYSMNPIGNDQNSGAMNMMANGLLTVNFVMMHN
tara:strand:- start:23 stop:928 length:906 start_codon:yes stop_codon:yes gene_type:complete